MRKIKILYTKDVMYVESVIISFDDIVLVIDKCVINQILSVINNKPIETGGILYGSKLLKLEEYVISGNTFQQPKDVATYSNFERKDNNHFKLLKMNRRNDKSLMYFGDWHYHPVDYVSPSNTDLISFERNSKSCKTDSKYMFNIICSKKEFAIYIYDRQCGMLIHNEKYFWED